MEFLVSAFASQQQSPSPSLAAMPPLPILPLIALETLPRWVDTQPPEYDTNDAAVVAPTATGFIPSGVVQFPVRPALNRKLILMQGDLLGLQVDAVVNSTNERLSDFHQSTLSSRLVAYAGPHFVEECRTLVHIDGGIATGEAALMSSHALGRLHHGAKYVIQCVAPKYSEKYQTAAENALHGCVRRSLELLLDQGDAHSIAFPLITTARKCFPLEEAAHITFRTLRKFLDRYGEKTIHTIVLCLEEGRPCTPTHSRRQSQSTSFATAAPSPSSASSFFAASSTLVQELDESEVMRVYQRILPLYFPRTDTEAERQKRHLPRYTGDENGERVVEERRIRLVDFIASGPTPFTDEQRNSMAEAHTVAASTASAVVASASPTAAAAAASSPSSSSTSSPSRSRVASSAVPTHPLPTRTEYVPASEMPRESTRRLSATPHSSAGPPTRPPDTVTTADADFTSAQEHPDALRARTFTTAAHSIEREAEMRENDEYFRRLKYAQSSIEPEMALLNASEYILPDSRTDVFGRRVIEIVGARLPVYHADGVTLRVLPEQLIDHALRTLDPLTQHPFVVLYYHTGVTNANYVDVTTLRTLWQLLTRAIRANLKAVYFVHPTWSARSRMYLLASLIDAHHSFWSKLTYVHQLTDLAQHLDVKALAIPPHVARYDRDMYGSNFVANSEHEDEGL